MSVLLDNRLYRRLAIGAQWLVVASSLGLLAIEAFQYYLVDLGQPLDPDSFAYTVIDRWQSAVSNVRMGLLVLAFVTFVAWFYRGYLNLHRLNLTPRPTQSAGWVIGSWLVPVANFWLPYRLLKELWWLTQRYALDAELSPDHGLVTGWWTLRLVALFVARFSGLGGDPTTLAELHQATMVLIVVLLLDIGCALLTVVLLRQQGQHEEALAARYAPGAPPATAAAEGLASTPL